MITVGGDCRRSGGGGPLRDSKPARPDVTAVIHKQLDIYSTLATKPGQTGQELHNVGFIMSTNDIPQEGDRTILASSLQAFLKGDGKDLRLGQ